MVKRFFVLFMLVLLSAISSCGLFYPQGYASLVSGSTSTDGGQSASVSANVPRDGLVGEWLFSGNLLDTSGNGNNASAASYSVTTDRFGSTAAFFVNHSMGSYNAVVESSATLDTGSMTSFTISFWVLADITPSGALVCLETTNPEPTNLYVIGNSAGQLNFRNLTNYDYNSWFNDVNLTGFYKPAKSWHHVCIIADRVTEEVRLAVDDNVMGPYSVQILNLVAPRLYFGNSQLSFGYDAYGVIDDVRFYNRALTVSDVDLLYHERGWDTSGGQTTSTMPNWTQLPSAPTEGAISNIDMYRDQSDNLYLLCENTNISVYKFVSPSWANQGNLIMSYGAIGMGGGTDGAFFGKLTNYTLTLNKASSSGITNYTNINNVSYGMVGASDGYGNNGEVVYVNTSSQVRGFNSTGMYDTLIQDFSGTGTNVSGVAVGGHIDTAIPYAAVSTDRGLFIYQYDGGSWVSKGYNASIVNVVDLKIRALDVSKIVITYKTALASFRVNFIVFDSYTALFEGMHITTEDMASAVDTVYDSDSNSSDSVTFAYVVNISGTNSIKIVTYNITTDNFIPIGVIPDVGDCSSLALRHDSGGGFYIGYNKGGAVFVLKSF
ncbi:MAG: LamG domain-containing protein [Sedimentisphaerales bacterium]|nr:LamG domain-containing protein [Sedimentisphaerales bacterium]